MRRRESLKIERGGHTEGPVNVIDTTQRTSVVPLPELFISMLKVSLYGVGGGTSLVWARRIAVEQRHWLTEEDFVDIVSLCQFMPGPNIVGIATCIGTRLHGAVGAVVAVAGFLLIPGVIGFAIGLLWLQYAEHPVIRHTLGGIASVGAGLLIATGIKMLMPYRTRGAALFFAAASFGLIVVAKLPLPIVLLAVAPLSIAAAVFRRAGAR
jgi:chromate transporter